MIPAEDEEPTHNPAPDSDYYSDLISRVDNAVGVEEENDADEGVSTQRSRVGAFAGWIRGGGHRTHQRLSSQDEDDIESARQHDRRRPRKLTRQSQKKRRQRGDSSSEEDEPNEDDMSAETSMIEEVCLFPSTITEWILQPMVKIVLVALITGLVGGIEAANAMFSVHSVTTHFGLSPLEHSGLVTASIVGGTLGGLVGGSMADLYGRKFVLVVTGMALLPTALTAAAATTIGAVVFARACAAAVAMATASAAIAYVFELAPRRRRGMMPAVWGSAATAAWACVRMAALHTPSSSMSKHGWRVVGGGPHLILAFAQLLSLCSLPESPRWLASQNKMHEAQVAIHRIHGTAFSSATAHVIRSELTSLQPSKYVMLLAALDKGVDPNNRAKGGRAEKKKSTVASRGSYNGGEWEPAWGDASRPCEQCVALVANSYHTSLKTYVALKRWRPVVTLFSSMCTASTAAGGLQVLYWNSKVLEPLLISPVLAEVLLTLSPLTAAFISILLLMDDRNGRRPLVISGACLVVGGSLLLSVLLVVFIHLPWHGPIIGLRWLLGLPGAIGAIASSSGWQLMVISLLPCLVAEATPAHARCRALAMLTATSVIYAPFTLVGFDTARDNAGAIGPALLMYSCSAGSMLIFLVTVLLVETAGKEPEQILLETINRAGYVLFHMTSMFQGSQCERWAGGLSYAPVGTQCPHDDEDDLDEEDADDDEIAKAMRPNKSNEASSFTAPNQFKRQNDAEEPGQNDEVGQEFGTDAKNGRVATAAGAGSLVGMIGGLSYMALKSSIKSRNDALSPPTGAGDGSSFSSNDSPHSNQIRMKRQLKATHSRRRGKNIEEQSNEENERMIKEDDEDTETEDEDEVNLDEISDRKTTPEAKPTSKEDSPAKESANSQTKLNNGITTKQEEKDVSSLIAKLEKDKKDAITSEDYARAASITQAIKKLKGEPDVPSSTMNSLASYSTLPAPSPFQLKKQQQNNDKNNPKQGAKKMQEQKQQRKAAAAMFDSMMDDF